MCGFFIWNTYSVYVCTHFHVAEFGSAQLWLLTMLIHWYVCSVVIKNGLAITRAREPDVKSKNPDLFKHVFHAKLDKEHVFHYETLVPNDFSFDLSPRFGDLALLTLCRFVYPFIVAVLGTTKRRRHQMRLANLCQSFMMHCMSRTVLGLAVLDEILVIFCVFQTLLELQNSLCCVGIYGLSGM